MTVELFEKWTLSSGSILKNRILMAPMTIQAAFFDGSVTQDMIDYYRHRAGEAAAIIVESAFIDEKGRGFPGALGIHKDTQVKGLSKLARAIQREGSKAILQIYHAGRMAAPELNGGTTPVSASPVAAVRPDAATPKEMSSADIERVICQFKEAVRRAIEAGFDGVEIHGANTYLVQQFYSPHSNRRQDEWGGTQEKRLRFPTAVVEAVQEETKRQRKEDFIIGYRFSPEEIEELGIRFADTMVLLNHLAKWRPDYFHVSMGSWNRTSIVDKEDRTRLIDNYLAMQSDELAQIPLIGVGNIGQRADAEKALEAGYDLVSVGKGFLVEPKWVQKAKANEPIREFVEIHEQRSLCIPDPLWDVMSFLIQEDKEDERKYERLKKWQHTKQKREPSE